MQGLRNFIVSPIGSQFKNTEEIGGIQFITSTSIEEAKNVNRNAKVVSLPIDYKGNIKVGDEVIIHHNIFRPQYDHKGIVIQSNQHIKDNLYWVPKELIYMIIRQGEKIAVDDNVFVQPFTENDYFLGVVEKEHSGIVRYSNDNSQIGKKIAFRRNCEFEFNIDGEKLYCMKKSRLLAELN